jgi:hypothetical protein
VGNKTGLTDRQDAGQGLGPACITYAHITTQLAYPEEEHEEHERRKNVPVNRYCTLRIVWVESIRTFFVL